MSQENVELVHRAIDAFNRRDPDAFIALLHPEVEWEEGGDVLPGLRGTYHGRAEVRKWYAELLEPWESFHVHAEEITDATDGRVFLGFLDTARGRGSGAETELRGWQVTWHADGKVERRQVFWTRAEALEAAGLSE
jgi:ketosteroid isomerase-like protein